MLRILVFIFITIAQFVAAAEDTSLMVDAKLEVSVTEVQRPILLPIHPDFPEAETLPFPRQVFHIEAQVSFCRPVVVEDFRLVINELDGINYVSLHSIEPFIDCDGPLKNHTFIYKVADSVNTKLPFVQLSPTSLAGN